MPNQVHAAGFAAGKTPFAGAGSADQFGAFRQRNGVLGYAVSAWLRGGCEVVCFPVNQANTLCCGKTWVLIRNTATNVCFQFVRRHLIRNISPRVADVFRL